MDTAEQLHPQYITDEQGNRVSVILSVAEYNELLEDLDALAAIADRREEPTISHDQLIADLKRDGFLRGCMEEKYGEGNHGDRGHRDSTSVVGREHHADR